MAIQIGQQAPDFILTDDHKNKVTLSEQLGKKTVLLFFPFAFTSVCTAELCHIRDNIKTFENLDANVFGISVDSPFTLSKFREEQQLNFPLLSDFNKTVSSAYHCLYENFVLGLQGVSKRAAFVIDSAGIVQYAEVLENATEIPNFTAIDNCLKSIQ
jgi:glutaredoxin-dependent peroxiredoxin